VTGKKQILPSLFHTYAEVAYHTLYGGEPGGLEQEDHHALGGRKDGRGNNGLREAQRLLDLVKATKTIGPWRFLAFSVTRCGRSQSRIGGRQVRICPTLLRRRRERER